MTIKIMINFYTKKKSNNKDSYSSGSNNSSSSNISEISNLSWDFDKRKPYLLNLIRQNPGIKHRELRQTGLANGVLTHHLKGLEENYTIKINRQLGSTRYYPIDIAERESNIIPFVRHDVTRQILLFILQHDNNDDSCTFNEIVENSKKFPSAISGHLKRLKEAGIIYIHYDQQQRRQMYRITDRKAVIDVLEKYQTNFIDKTVDKYIDFLDEL